MSNEVGNLALFSDTPRVVALKAQWSELLARLMEAIANRDLPLWGLHLARLQRVSWRTLAAQQEDLDEIARKKGLPVEAGVRLPAAQDLVAHLAALAEVKTDVALSRDDAEAIGDGDALARLDGYDVEIATLEAETRADLGLVVAAEKGGRQWVFVN